MVKIFLILDHHYTFLYCQQVQTVRNMFGSLFDESDLAIVFSFFHSTI